MGGGGEGEGLVYSYSGNTFKYIFACVFYVFEKKKALKSTDSANKNSISDKVMTIQLL